MSKPITLFILVSDEEVNTKQGKGFMDLTGRFPFHSGSGNEYIMIAYNYDANAILAEPVKNREAKSLADAWETLHKKFENCGVSPTNYVLDNKCSQLLKNAFKKHNCDFQRVPPDNHRANAAERAIQTFKNHFKAGLACVDPKFPIKQWDLLLEQAILTLNMLRKSRLNPKLSAHDILFGVFNYNATPIAPPGMRVVAHDKPTKRRTWDFNGEEGFYVGPALENYRCVKVFFPRTRSVRKIDTLTFIPHEIPVPEVSLEDFLCQSLDDLKSLLAEPPSSVPITLEAGDLLRNAYKRIMEAFNKKYDLTSKQKENNVALTRVLEPKTTVKYADDTVPLRRSPRLRHQHNFIQELFRMEYATNIYHENGKKVTLEEVLSGKYTDLASPEIWNQSLSNEFGRVTQGNDAGVKATDCCEFIFHWEIPDNKKVTYANWVLDHRPLKSEPFRIRLVVGGDKLDYLEDAGSPAATMLETKILLNSTISDADKGAKFMSADLKDFFLKSIMPEPEYMRIPWNIIPNDIIRRYNLTEKRHGDYVYVKITKGMYGLKQAAILAYKQLCDHLASHGYTPIEGTDCMFKHKTRRTIFCLCVDDFGIKYYSKADADHLINALKEKYEGTQDWSGKHFCGYTIDWHYEQRYVDISMPTYVPAALKRLNYIMKKYPEYAPYDTDPIIYGKKGQQQYTKAPDDSNLLDPVETKYIQSLIGTFLYYGRALDGTILPALNSIATQQAQPTEQTKKRCQRLLDYLNTYPNICLRFHASDMILKIDSDAAYLVLPKAKSRIAGYFQLTNQPPSPPLHNAPILIECRGLQHVVCSSAEAETAGLFNNAQVALPIRRLLIAIGHPQPATPIKTDNSTAAGFVNNNIKITKAKTWHMRMYWLREKEVKKIFKIYWEEAAQNYADYYTKTNHTILHHCQERRKHVTDLPQ